MSGLGTVVYLSKIGSVIYVLHCFEKESRKTDKRDIATARVRLKQVLKRTQEEKISEVRK